MKTYDDFYAEIVNPILDGEINVIRVEKRFLYPFAWKQRDRP
uniref:Uncharacterized protein n=1 Tax=Rhizobium phage IG49 TaxID=3129228 RepID=A0AAU8HYT1_9CAUD